MLTNNTAYRAGGRKRNLGEKLGQEFGPVIEDMFNTVVKVEVECVEDEYRAQGKMYEFDAKYEEIQSQARESMYERFYRLSRVLDKHPALFYEIESLIDQIEERETEAHYERMCPKG